MLKPVTLAEFDTAVRSGELVLVYYTATWCGPCQKVSPVFETLEGCTLVKVDADAGGDILDSQGIESIPSVQVWKNGVKVNTVQGIRPDKLTNLHKELMN